MQFEDNNQANGLGVQEEMIFRNQTDLAYLKRNKKNAVMWACADARYNFLEKYVHLVQNWIGDFNEPLNILSDEECKIMFLDAYTYMHKECDRKCIPVKLPPELIDFNLDLLKNEDLFNLYVAYN
ncbi:hypothetical protein TKK_0011527 [Trichogramma kaykai]